MTDQSSSEKTNRQEFVENRDRAFDAQDPALYHDDIELQRVETGGENHEFIFIGRQKS